MATTTVNADALEKYQDAVVRLGKSAKDYAEDYLKNWMAKNSGASVAEVRNYTIQIIRSTLANYGPMAQELSAEMWELMRQAYNLPSIDTSLTYDPPTEQIEKVAHYQAGKLAKETPDKAAYVEQVGSYVQHTAQDAASDATIHYVEVYNDMVVDYNKKLSMLAQSKQAGEWSKVDERGRRNWDETAQQSAAPEMRYARILHGEDNCTWCITLASHGFYYKSASSAAAGHHEHCDCGVAAAPAGSRPSNYKKLYGDYKFFSEMDGLTNSDGTAKYSRSELADIKSEFFHADSEKRKQMRSQYLGISL